MRDVIGHLIKILEKGGEAIVCQVVETRGSTPQKAGSMMIVDPDGGQGGTLGGGCVENEVKTKAMQQISSGAAAVHSFVLDHDYAWADGLDLRRPDGGDRAAGARAGAARVFPFDRQVSRGRPRLHRGGRARHGSGGRAAGGQRDFCSTVKVARGPVCRRETFPTGSLPGSQGRQLGRNRRSRTGSRSCRAGRASG